jgi:hypothetical protein
MANNPLGKFSQGIAQQKGKALDDRSSSGKEQLMPLTAINPRAGFSVREVIPSEVDALMGSIAQSGLISPLCVDQNGALLAGEHRRQALIKLRDAKPDRFNALFPSGVPVRVMPFDSSQDALEALRIQAAENEFRKSHTKADIRRIADELRSQGYVDVTGRPKPGEKPLKHELATMLHVSTRHIRSVLNEPIAPPQVGSNSDLSPEWKRRRSSLTKWKIDAIQQPNGDELAHAIDRVLELLQDADRP